MKNDNRMYGQQFDSSVVKDLEKIDKKLKEEQDPEEIVRLRMAKLCRGMELNSTPFTRNYRGYFPY